VIFVAPSSVYLVLSRFQCTDPLLKALILCGQVDDLRLNSISGARTDNLISPCLRGSQLISKATELGLAALGGMTPSHGLEATKLYAVVCKVKQQVFLETVLQTHAKELLPTWLEFHRNSNRGRFSELQRALHHHVNRQRLIGVWTVKESLQRILQDRTGTVITEIRSFLRDTFGNPEVSDTGMQAAWANLLCELVRINSLRPQLRIVRDVTAKIEESGAPVYASMLRKPLAGTTDSLLPDDWRRCWRLKRLATHLEAIDAKDVLGTLWKARKDAETSLARAYHDIVVKRTWLKLAENASPAIRAALQAYLGAIQKIGKGTGKRAVRYRQDARMAATQSNPAVPCWIMSHHRIAETLPAELGCFDLVVIDEASQSDLTALPALLRARKILVVGDDKQVSPEGVGLEEEKVGSELDEPVSRRPSGDLPPSDVTGAVHVRPFQGRIRSQQCDIVSFFSRADRLCAIR
jgi:hypothetical protein